MNSNNLLINFVYDIYRKKIHIWVQDLAIKVFVPTDITLTEDEKQFIKDNKQKLISLLVENEMFTKESENRILKCNFEEIYPLSYAQERLWFLEQFEQGSYIYNIPRVYRLSASTNLDVLKDSLNKIASRHEILRSFIRVDSMGSGYQSPDPDFKKVPISTIQTHSREELDSLINTNANRIFDLENEYPISITFYEFFNAQNENSEWYLSVIFHHIACDGWSIGIFMHELKELYWAALNDSNPQLPALRTQYKDFSVWQRKCVTRDSVSEQLNYWRSKLEGYELLCLPQTKNRPIQVDYFGENIDFMLDINTSNNLRAVAKQLNISLYTLLLGGYFILLNNLTNQNDIIIGTVIANRSHEHLEQLIGFFVNTLALRIKIDPNEKFMNFIEKLREDVINAQINQDLPFEKLIDYLNVPLDTSRHPLFQVMFVAYNFEQRAASVTHELLESYSYPAQDISSKFDLTTTWDETNPQLKCNFNFRTSLFNKDVIEKYINIYKQILLLIASDVPSDVLPGLSMNHLLDKIGTENILSTELMVYPTDKTLFSLFDEQASLTPYAIAITDAKLNKDFSYKELALDVEKITTYLISISKQSKSQLIGILSEKGYNHAVTTLSIMKSGHAYLPLHHDWPISRINDVLIQGDVSVLLVSRDCFYRSNIDADLSSNYKIIIIEDLLEKVSCEETVLKNLPHVLSNDVAYVIFTSGSTGKPKGVTISHRGAINTLYAVNQKFSINSHDVILALSELSFDLSVYDIFGVLAVGGRVVFPNSDYIKVPSHWVDLISRYKISIWNSVPQLAGLLIEETEAISNSLRLFLLSGDWIPIKLPGNILEKHPQSKIISLGGATEGSIWSIWYEINEIQQDWNSIPYGNAMPNQNMLVLNDSKKICSSGVVGEIYIGGEGVALNYWGDSQRTKDSFIETSQYGRIYKTGDLGRWSSHGYIEFMGRKDSQVKLNGYRIELDEISIHLSKLDGVADVVSLLIKSNGQEYICSYYVGVRQEEAIILEKLQQLLPEYMIPVALIYLECMPLTSNGKLDRQQLPKPELSYKKIKFVSPRNTLEKQMCDVFSKILNIESKQIGIYDDFFKLGGDSISSIRLVSLLRKELGIAVTAKNVFSCRNVCNLYGYVMLNSKKNMDTKKILAEQGILKGTLNLLPIQHWFFSSRIPNINYFNQSFLIKVPCLNLNILQESIYKLIEYHDVLRIRYKPKNKDSAEYIQYYSDNEGFITLKTFDIRSLDNTNKTLSQVLTNWQCGFNIVDGPLCSFGYLSGYDNDTARIHVAIHHLLIDAVSWRNLTTDLKLIYQSLSNRAKIDLSTKGTSYRQWVELMQKYPAYNRSEEKYWQRIVGEYNKNPPLESSINAINVITCAKSSLDEEMTQKLLLNANTSLNTEINDLLLTVLAYALADVTQRGVNYITLEGHGREDISESVDISNTLGWFTTMYPVRLEINTSFRMAANIKLIKENLRGVPGKGLGYGALIGFSSQELPKITFNYLGQFENQESNDTWCIVGEDSGAAVSKENIEQGIISINSAIIGSKFEISFKCKLDQIKTDYLANQFIHYLKQLIDYLATMDKQEYTMSDFPDFDPYTIIANGEQQEASLFILPPGIGGYECYLNNIVPELDYNLVLFNNFNSYLREIFDCDSLKDLGFESLAETYIAHIKTIQPTGPYALFGWSFGGVLALEISKQFVQAGEHVSHLFIVDSYFKVSDAFKKLNSKKNEIEIVGHLNYKYNPKRMSKLNCTKIILFKAMDEHIGENNELFNYYAKNEKYNSLDQIISKEEIILEPIQASHFSWVTSKSVVNQIAHTIKSTLKASK